MKDILDGQGKRLIHVAANGQAEFVDVYRARKIGPMPAHIVLIVRREDALVEDLERGFEPGRASTLQDHPPLLRVGCRDRPCTRTSWDFQIDCFFGPGRCG